MTPTALACGCPTGPGLTITDAAAHVAWQQLVVDQGGPVGVVNIASTTAARGFGTPTPAAETILDVKARQSGRRANKQQREASR